MSHLVAVEHTLRKLNGAAVFGSQQILVMLAIHRLGPSTIAELAVATGITHHGVAAQVTALRNKKLVRYGALRQHDTFEWPRHEATDRAVQILSSIPVPHS